MSTVPEDVIGGELMSHEKCWCGGKISIRDGSCRESAFHDPFSDGRPKEIRRLYIAGPMSSYPENNYPAFNDAAKRLMDVGFEVVNPAGVHLEKCHYVDLLREDLRVMLECHGVAVLESWWESTGARNEVQVAGLLRMPIRTVDHWLYISQEMG